MWLAREERRGWVSSFPLPSFTPFYFITKCLSSGSIPGPCLRRENPQPFIYSERIFTILKPALRMPSFKVQGSTCPTPYKARFYKRVFPASPTHWQSSTKRNQNRSLTLVRQRIRNDSFLTQREGPRTHTLATT